MPPKTHQKLQQTLFEETSSLTSGIVSHYAKLIPKHNTPSMMTINTYSAKVYSQFFKQLNLVSMLASQAQKEERVLFQNQMGMLFLMMLLLSVAFGLSLDATVFAVDGSMTGVAQRINGLLNDSSSVNITSKEQRLVKTGRHE